MDRVTLKTTLPTLAATSRSNTSTVVSPCRNGIISSAENHAYATFMIIVLLMTLCGNIIVIAVVSLSRKLGERSTFYFVASLALSDTIIASFQIPIRISLKYHGMWFCFGLPVCYMRLMMDVIGNVASICNLLLISIDRFTAVTFPYRYPEYLSKTRSIVLICSTWIFAICWSVVGTISWDNQHPTFSISINQLCMNSNITFYMVSFFGIFIPALIVMSVLLCRIFFIAVRQIRQIKRLAVSSPASAVSTPPSVVSTPPTPLTPENRNRSQYRRFSKRTTMVRELKATKSVFIVYIAFIVVWLPNSILHMLLFFQKSFKVTKAIWFTFFDVLPVVNTSVNPVIYAFYSKQFREASQYLWRKLLVKAKITDNYLSRNQQTKRAAKTSNTIENPYAIGNEGRLRVSGVTIIEGTNSPQLSCAEENHGCSFI